MHAATLVREQRDHLTPRDERFPRLGVGHRAHGTTQPGAVGAGLELRRALPCHGQLPAPSLGSGGVARVHWSLTTVFWPMLTAPAAKSLSETSFCGGNRGRRALPPGPGSERGQSTTGVNPTLPPLAARRGRRFGASAQDALAQARGTTSEVVGALLRLRDPRSARSARRRARRHQRNLPN